MCVCVCVILFSDSAYNEYAVINAVISQLIMLNSYTTRNNHSVKICFPANIPMQTEESM